MLGSKSKAERVEKELRAKIFSYKYDPYGYVWFAYPWMVKGTILEKETGPDKWQKEFMDELGERHRNNTDGIAIQMATASGHGIGKGALVAWIIQWYISTHEFPQIVVTANTKTQLETKTWRELSKWHNLSINKHWFTWTATKFYMTAYQSTWFASAIPWSEHNSEAFAGTHEKNVLMIFDESSAIANSIWTVANGAMTTLGAIWLTFGNPTQNTGQFRECFGRYKHRWITRQIDSRECKMTNKKQIQQWIDDYGEDSDFVRVRVKGIFPKASSLQLISSEVVNNASKRDNRPETYRYAPIIIGVDVARHGDDQTCFVVRQGSKVLDIKRFRELEEPQIVSRILELINEYRNINKNIFVFVDLVGFPGVTDTVSKLHNNVYGVNPGSSASHPHQYANKRAEMWCDMRNWLRDCGQIPDDQELKDDLTGIEYGYTMSYEKIQLEKKEDMKSRGLSSPDSGDALSYTFAMPISIDAYASDFYEDEYEDYRTALSSSGKSKWTGY